MEDFVPNSRIAGTYTTRVFKFSICNLPNCHFSADAHSHCVVEEKPGGVELCWGDDEISQSSSEAVAISYTWGRYGLNHEARKRKKQQSSTDVDHGAGAEVGENNDCNHPEDTLKDPPRLFRTTTIGHWNQDPSQNVDLQLGSEWQTFGDSMPSFVDALQRICLWSNYCWIDQLSLPQGGDEAAWKERKEGIKNIPKVLANENTGVNWLDAIISGMRNAAETGYMFPPDGQDQAEYTGKIFRLSLFVEISNTKLREGMESLTGKSYTKIVPPAFTMMGMTPQLYATKKLAFNEIFEIVCLMIGLEVNVAKRNSPNHHGPFHLVVDPGLNGFQLDPDNPDYHKLIPPRIGLSRINYDLEDRPTTYTVCLTPPQGFVSSLGVMLEVKLLDPEGNSRTVPSGQRERTSDFEITGVWVMPADYVKEDVFQDITGQLVEGKMDIGNDDSFREYLKTWQ